MAKRIWNVRNEGGWGAWVVADDEEEAMRISDLYESYPGKMSAVDITSDFLDQAQDQKELDSLKDLINGDDSGVIGKRIRAYSMNEIMGLIEGEAVEDDPDSGKWEIYFFGATPQ